MSEQQKTRAIKDAEQAVARILGQIGPSDAVTRFLSRYGKIRTKKVYCIHMQSYLRWLKTKKVGSRHSSNRRTLS